MAEATAIRDLGKRYLYRWLGGIGIGALLVLAGVFLVRPTNAWLVGVNGVLVVSLLGSAVIDVSLGDRLGATGSAIAAGGFLVWGVGAAGSFSDGTFWGGFALLCVGGVLTLFERVRSVL